MKSTPLLRTVALSLLASAALAHATTVTGTVTNKTTSQPAAGDTVVLVDVQSGMAEVAKAVTDAHGRYALKEPGTSPYLVRATHQGATYFIAAPSDGAQGDISVFDVAAKVPGVYTEADVIEVETVNGQLRVTERYFVHNTSTPPRAQWSQHTFSIVLPEEAVVAGVEAQRPTGLPTSLKLDPDGPKGHYSFNFPIQPDDGDKSTLFELNYALPYTSGKFTFKPQESLATQNIGVLLPMSMTFTAGAGSVFQPLKQDPGIQTFVAKNLIPGKALEFTVSGSGSIPREAQATPPGPQSGNSAPDAGATGNQPGGGIGAPINTPDPFTKYKWWVATLLVLVLAGVAAFVLRKPQPNGAQPAPLQPNAFGPGIAHSAAPATGNAALLNALKEELFALESEKIAGTLSLEEYATLKSALETVLKRALHRSAQ